MIVHGKASEKRLDSELENTICCRHRHFQRSMDGRTWSELRCMGFSHRFRRRFEKSTKSTGARRPEAGKMRYGNGTFSIFTDFDCQSLIAHRFPMHVRESELRWCAVRFHLSVAPTISELLIEQWMVGSNGR